MLFLARGSKNEILDMQSIRVELQKVFDVLGARKKVLVVPPDQTRSHSGAGLITRLAAEYYQHNLVDILPALGTHKPMNEAEIAHMFGAELTGRVRVHDWKNDAILLGSVEKEFIEEKTEGLVSFAWPVAINRLLCTAGHDLLLSVGQVVPHEVIGMANYNKNILVGTAGKETIDKSHFLGAVWGMERIMGRARNPLRDIFNHAAGRFLSDLPLVYILTVVGPDASGGNVIRGLFAGDDEECFYAAAELSREINIAVLEKRPSKIVVYLDPAEFKSTWLGNKSIYRTRLALRTGGNLIVLAPGVSCFGEDPGIDALIRKYGYRGKKRILELVEHNADLRGNLAAAAHLIHGSTEGRFTVTYCPGRLSQQEVESVGFDFSPLTAMLKRYDPTTLKPGYNTLTGGEEIFYIANPALGLWMARDQI